MNEKILVVDDSKELRELAAAILKMQGYEVVLAEDGKEALAIFDKISPDLIVSDIAMPEMDGFAFLDAIRSQEKGKAIPFLFLSAYSAKESLSQARRLAVDDYLFKPFDAQELLDAVRVRLDRREAVKLFDTREAHFQTVMLMANIIEARDPYTRGHIDRVCDISIRFGKKLGWDEASLTVLEFGAILHDIGKLVVPAEVLNKGHGLSAEEWRLMYKHPERGAEMLNGIDHLKPAIPFILYHHERWNGSGYPYGLKGEKIPLAGRILALADVYDAISSKRPYHDGQSKDATLKMIKDNSGVLFDPFLVSKFLEAMNE